MARRTAEAEPIEDTSTVPADTTTEAVTETETTEAPDIDAFKLEAEAAIESEDYESVTTVYRGYDRKAKAAASRWLSGEAKSAMKEGTSGFPRAQALLVIEEAVKKPVPSERKAREPKAPANPTEAFVARLASYRIAYRLTDADAPEGIDEDYAAQVETLVSEGVEHAATLQAWLDADDEAKGDEPEVPEAVKQAVKLANRKLGSRSTGGGSRTPYAGVRRNVSAHIAEAFADQPVGTFLTVADIRSFDSSEYGEDSPSAGAISARLKSPKFNLEGIAPGQSPEDKFGATKTA